MNEVQTKIENGILIIKLSGRISSDNAIAVEGEIAKAKEGYSSKEAIIDVENLEYISSAGLRIILRIRKEYPECKIINANSEVYEIFEMTGFTEMMTIEKAYRRISVEGCEIIGRGSNGEVYRLDPDTIIKVYLNPDSLPDIHRERELARRAFVLGIPTAIPYDVVKVGEGYGSVFELLSAKSFAKLLIADPTSIDNVVTMSVDLLKKIHSTEVLPTDMPSIKEVALTWVDYLKDHLPEATWNKLGKLVNEVPETHMMIHGDYHVKNIMLQNGEVLLIDMDTLSQGHPVFEFAAIFNAYIGFNILHPEGAKSFLGIDFELCKQMWQKTLELYFGTTDQERLQEIQDKVSILSYARILRRTIKRIGLADEQVKKDCEFYKNQIITLVDKVDTLLF